MRNILTAVRRTNRKPTIIIATNYIIIIIIAAEMSCTALFGDIHIICVVGTLTYNSTRVGVVVCVCIY